MDVVVVDDHPMMRFGIKAYLGSKEDICVVGESEKGGNALELIESKQPDLVILSLNPTAETDGIELCQQSKSLEPPPRVLAYSSSSLPEDLTSCFMAGADGFLHKSAEGQPLLDAARNTVAGRGPWQTKTELEIPKSPVSGLEGNELTARETQIMELILQRYSYAEMGEALYISPNTAKNHVSKILKKFKADSRKELLSRTLLATT